MMTLNEFKTNYKTISNTDLLAILDYPEDYQNFAVEAAKEEFSKRQLSGTEIQEARQSLIAKKEQGEKRIEKVKIVMAEIKSLGHSIIDTVNPVQFGILTTDKTIRLIVIIFGGISLYQLIKDFNLHLAVFQDIPRFPLDSLMHLLPLMILPVATFLFWKRLKMGWILLTIYLTFSAVNVLGLLFFSFSWKPSGIPVFDNLYPRPDPLVFIVSLIFFIGAVYLLCNSAIRKHFSIDKQKMISTIGITGFVTLLFILLIS